MPTPPAPHDQLLAALREKEALAQALAASEERLRHTLEAANVGFWEWDIATNRVVWSDNIETIFGLTPGSFAGTYEAWLALVHPDDREGVQGKVAEALAARGSYEAEFRVVRGQGVGWQSTRGYVVVAEDGSPKFLRGIVFDVTARRSVEDSLRMQARVLENMSEGVSVADEKGIILYTNPAENRMFGYEPGELVGQHVSVQNAYTPEENQRIVAEVMAHLRATGEWIGEWKNRRKDGRPFTTRSRITSVVLEGQQRWLCVQEDVTAEAEARAHADLLATALRESDERYRAFVNQSTEGIWRIEVEAPIAIALSVEQQVDAFYKSAVLAECNDAMARMYGFDEASSLVGKRLGELLVREDSRNSAYLSAFVQSGYRLQGAQSHEVDKDGNARVFENGLVGIIKDGNLVRAWGTQRDITAQVQGREQAETANRVKDEFLAMLGHELRNPLSPILTALELMKLRDGRAFPRERAIIERQVKHVVRLVDDLLDVSRMTRGKVTLERRCIEVQTCVATAIELASPLLEQRAHHLSVEVPSGLVVNADPTRMSQVFANLLNNAAKYTPPGGTITVVADEVEHQVRIRVKDSGLGIRRDILPRIFDLFVQEHQTVDRSQGGLGLGLAIVRSLVNQHGGRVVAHSAGEGLGSEFSVFLPMVDAAAADGLVSTMEARVRRKGGRILVVDDNRDAADLLAAALADFGHTVRVAYDGPSALALLEVFLPQLALLDLGLPVMDGYELARRLRADARLGGVCLVAVTGYGERKDREASQAAGFDEHLVKPVNLPDIERVIQKLIGANPAHAER